MASLVYNSFWDDVARGNIVPANDTFYMMIVGAGYVENKDTHTKRSDISAEVSGAGYTAGGVACSCVVAKDTATDKVTLTFGPVTIPNCSITGAKGVIYKRRGGASSADELVAVDDFGGNVVSVQPNGFQVAACTITLQN